MKRGSREPSNLSESLCHRLNSYALAARAAGVGMLALARPAEAKIVYHHVHHHIGRNSNYKLDLNHDGITDFTLKDYYDEQYGETAVLSLILPFVWQNTGVWASNSGYVASALRAGIVVSSKAPFAGNLSEHMAAEVNGHSFYGWCRARNRYLGLKFPIGGREHFAWARLSVTCRPSGVVATLTGYAYETIPNKPIIAGKTHGGASLGALAAGSTALSGRRHKIRSK